LRRYAVTLTEGAHMEALQRLLEPICKGTNEIAAEIALDYYSDDPKERKALAMRLEQHGITSDTIQAKAMQICGSGLLTFDRMIGNRETARRLLRKELARRLESDLPSPSAPPKQANTPKVASN
jgi:hypothetical protein